MTNLKPIQELVERLTEPQRRAVLRASSDCPLMVGRPRTLRKLAELGLCQMPGSWEINVTSVLARPIGVEAAAALRSRQAGGSE